MFAMFNVYQVSIDIKCELSVGFLFYQDREQCEL